MAFDTKNPLLNSIAGTPWTKDASNTSAADGALILTVIFDNRTGDGAPTGGTWTQFEKDQFWKALQSWSSVANIRFLEVDNPAAADLVERKERASAFDDPTDFGDHTSPPDDATSADVQLTGRYNIDIDWTNASIQPGGKKFNTFVHEIGHALGLEHPHQAAGGSTIMPALPDGNISPFGGNTLDHRALTIMSYKGRPEQIDWGQNAGPGALDIAAIQLMYGAVHNNTGDTVYTLSNAEAGGTLFQSIWDTGGIDTIQYNGTGNATIDLRHASLVNATGGGGFLSSVEVLQPDGSYKRIDGGFTIAADVTGFIPDVNGDWGVIIEQAFGGSGNDTLFGNAANNSLHGGDGNDHLDGFGGDDTMFGGRGNDTYVVDHANDKVFEAQGVAIGGVDKVFTSLNTYNLNVAGKGVNVEELQFVGKGNFVGTGNGLDNWLIGGEGNDTLHGNAGADHLAGGLGVDTLNGGSGNDWLNGEGGIDIMSGGDNDDTYVVDDSLDVVIETIGSRGRIDTPFGSIIGFRGGTDTVESYADWYQIRGYVENLVYKGAGVFKGIGNNLDNVIEGGNGGDDSHGDWLLGGKGNDAIFGFDGGDRLEGGAGHDDLDGGNGSDAFVIDNGDAVRGDFIDGGAGRDWVWADDSIAATGLRLNLFSAVVAPVSGGGGGADDVPGLAVPIVHVAGASAAINVERVDGTAVGDVIDASRLSTSEGLEVHGFAGNDTFFGGLGADTFDGGADTDTFVLIGSHTDYLFGTLGSAVYTLTSIAFDIVDTVMATELFTFADGTFTLADMVATIVTSGTEGADTLIGDGYSNILNGLGGDDALIGLASADTLDGGTGVDTADYSGSAAGVSVNLATGTGAGGDAEGDTLVAIENVTGSAFDDTLTGGADRGKLLGGDGNDTLAGGSWFDWMEGGTGNDTITGTGGQTVMVGGDGDDTLTGSLDNTNYFAGGAGNDVMRGGNTSDYISDVDGGNDWMYGGGGNDTLVDYAGVDHLYGEDGDDFMSSVGSGSFLDGGAGNDYVSVANGDYTLIGGSGIDTLEASGHGNVTFTGGADADILTYRIFGNGPLSYDVTDFEDGVDKILLWDHKYYGDTNPNLGFDSLTITDSTAGAIISWNGTSEMTLMGVSASQITAADFLVA